MTARISAVDLNVRELFEGNTVDNVRDVQKRVNHEIERKREELRVLVGESYRDLIDAADTIGSMQSSSVVICEKLQHLRSSLKGLPKNMSTGSALRSLQNKKFSETEMEIAAELKLTLEVPRYVRLNLDHGRIVEALHLYLFSTKLNLSSKPYKWTFLQGLDYNADPISSMKFSILCHTQSILEDFRASDLKLAECFVAEQVLSGQSCELVIQKFLQKHIENVSSILSERGEELLDVVTFALQSLHTIFIEPQLYSAVTKQVRKPKIQWTNLGITFTSKSMALFNNESISVSEPPRVSRLAEIVIQSFLKPLKSLLEKCYEQELYLTSEKSLQAMSEYRESATSMLSSHCEDFMRIVLGTTKSLWTEVFLHVFHLKCKAVVRDTINDFMDNLLTSSFPRLFKLDNEFDLIPFVWTATPLDEKDSQKLDDLKLKSVSPHVAEMNVELEKGCQLLFEDSRVLGDSLVKDFISAYLLEKLETFLRDLEKSSSGLFLGRWCATMTEFCPTLWKLLKQPESLKLRSTLSSISESCCSSWTMSVLEKYKKDLELCRMDLHVEQMTKAIAVAEEFSSEGEGALKPSVRVPLHLSHSLQSLLFGICFDFGRIGPQSIPKNVRDEFRFSVGEATGKLYEQMDLSHVTPQAALQLIFDLKYVQWFHPKLASTIEPPVTKLQGLIDPFDMDIVGPRLTVNLKRCLFENHLTLGLLFSEESHGFVAQNFKTKGNQTFPLANSIRHVPLPLLPV